MSQKPAPPAARRQRRTWLAVILLPTVVCVWIALWASLGEIDWNIPNPDVSLLHRESLWRSLSEAVPSRNDRYRRLFNVATPRPSSNNYWSSAGWSEVVKGSSSFDCRTSSWLQGERLGNTREFDDLSRDMILSLHSLSMDSATRVLRSSLCYASSKFASPGAAPSTGRDDAGNSNGAVVRAWTASLLFLAVHVHQHRHAVPEALARAAAAPPQQWNRSLPVGSTAHNSGVGAFDYQCPQAKFLVVRLFRNGLGANLRLGAVPALVAGLATDRVVLFVNNAAGVVSSNYFALPWSSASCPRRDHQCLFLPTTPCVITKDELASAYMLKKNEARQLFRDGSLPEAQREKRVIALKLTFRPQRTPSNLRQALHNLAAPIAARLAEDHPSWEPLLRRAADLILDEDENATQPSITEKPAASPRTHYYGANDPIFHSLLLYAMRPNPRAATFINRAVHDSLGDEEANLDNLVGLPIRASDKCGSESECFPMSKYLMAVVQLSMAHDVTNATVIVTTESAQVLDELRAFKNQGPSGFPIQFVLNRYDVLQGTGFLDQQDPSLNVTADQSVLSALASLKLQLASRFTVGNCCSNFHLILADLLSVGCGLQLQNAFQCLQDNPDPDLRPCCSWDRSPICLARRNQTHPVADVVA